MMDCWTMIGFNFGKRKMNQLISKLGIKNEIIIKTNKKFYGNKKTYKNVYHFDDKTKEILKLFSKVLKVSKKKKMRCCLCYSWFESDEILEHYNQNGVKVSEFELTIYGGIFDNLNNKIIKQEHVGEE